MSDLSDDIATGWWYDVQSDREPEYYWGECPYCGKKGAAFCDRQFICCEHCGTKAADLPTEDHNE